MIRAPSTLFWFALIIMVSVGLYHTSYRVHDLQQQLRALNAQIDVEQSNIHVLKAEVGYLSNPARIEAESKKYLASLHPTALKQIASLERLPTIAPTRAEAMAGTASVAVAAIVAAPSRKLASAADRARADTRMTTQRARAGVQLTASADQLPYDGHLFLAGYGNAQ